ncbi:HupE/UreJ family protein [Lacihabitans sp. CS3-21]|uniref:HupE/UreJ family protein n=1 Tax=Lacihabitans sp. CS3-21 TaxID=2487332 RepID=UPI0020CF65D1|nr:HupE/UreJ family protein [Lacihabitans sp. CS3-21]MCP9747384.1 HupE/UreJ family protein [Lacihabitans sp. CS3-21]
MNDFYTYFKLGYEHITDLGGYDHMLFIVALCAVYNLNQWRNILWVITFFTIGHSITLALSVMKMVNVDSDLIEFLIPCTIFFTSFSNFFNKSDKTISYINQHQYLRYFFTVFFGLIHGLGFSNYLKSLLGQSSNIVNELFAFNIGLEIGQLIIVVFFMLFTYMLINILNIKKRELNLIISALVAGLTLHLITDKWIF